MFIRSAYVSTSVVDEDAFCIMFNLRFLLLAETLKAFPKSTVTYKLFGGEDELHYGHYDLLCSRTVCSFPLLFLFCL